MDGNTLFLVTAAVAGIAGLLDRFALQRGKVSSMVLESAKGDGGYRRFALRYHVNSEPEWSELTYSFRDRKCPTTVIAGKTRSIAGCTPGQNAEYLLIRDDLLTPGQWELTVRIVTTSRRNPFYSLFPFTVHQTLQVTIP